MKSTDQLEANPSLQAVELPPTITIGELARLANLGAAKIVTVLLKNGVIATINDSIDRDTVEIVAEELGIKVKPQVDETIKNQTKAAEEQVRPPVVTILGHVDHGKTTLLDAIRKSDIAQGESGGITQHIGTYQVHWKNKENEERKIVFLDTPGHEAFSALRAHGTSVTDIVILVVAADEGVKPQTKEALSHAKSAGVPIIVAITKIDKPEANVELIKSQLVEIGLNPEDWGGKTPTVAVSAKTGAGLNDLLDLIILVADIAELKAPYATKAQGVVIEAHQQKGVGPMATLLIQQGTLKVGDAIVIGKVHGKIRFMEDEHGQRLNEATPSTSVKVVGLAAVPAFGSKFMIVENEKQARIKAQTNRQYQNKGGVVIEEAGEGPKLLNLIVKTDTDGSLKAIHSALESLASHDTVANIIYEGVGDVTESDTHMAVAAKTMVLAFRVGITPAAKNLVRSHKLIFNSYDVIYNLIDDVKAALEGMLEAEIVETEVGRLKVLKIFRTTKKFIIAGGRVEQGKIVQEGDIKVKRNEEIFGTGKITSLKQGQINVKEVELGNEAGLGVETSSQILAGDVLICSIKEEKMVRK